MKPSDRENFLKIVVGFAELKGKMLSAPALALYWNAMQDWELDDFQAAANQLLKTAQFMPQPKDFEDLRRAGRETAGEVFARIGEYLEYSPHGYRIKAGTPRSIESAIRAMGGADSYAMCRSDQVHFLEKRFCEHYEQISSHEDTREALPQIAYDFERIPAEPRKKIAGTFSKP